MLDEATLLTVDLVGNKFTILELCLMLVPPFRAISIRFTNNVDTISVNWNGYTVFFLSQAQSPSQMPWLAIAWTTATTATTAPIWHNNCT